MSKVKNLYEVIIPIYQCKLFIIITDDFVAAAKQAGFSLNKSFNTAAGIACRVSRKNGGCYFLGINKEYADDWSVIAHEALHITNFIFKDKGLKSDLSNDEAQAYLLQHIVSLVMEYKIRTASKLKKFIK